MSMNTLNLIPVSRNLYRLWPTISGNRLVALKVSLNASGWKQRSESNDYVGLRPEVVAVIHRQDRQNKNNLCDFG